MATVKIQAKTTGDIFEFNNLDDALRNLGGINPTGNRFEKVLLSTPSRRTFREAQGLLESNGYRIYHGEVKKVEIRVEGAKVTTQELPDGVEVKAQDEVRFQEKPKQPKDSSEAWEFMASQIQKFIKAPEVDLVAIMDQIDHNVKKGIVEGIDEALKTHTRTIVVEKKETGDKKEVGKQHYQFEVLLMTVAARVNALLVGPAGSGKTSAAHSVAIALGIPFYSISVGMQTTKTEFFGYTDATGKYVRTLFREAFEKGGVFLLDEMDAGNANVITAINQALANGFCAFPDGMIQKHPDFVIVSSANTFGTGANREYVGRNQLDAATLDRFAVIEWNYDELLESELCANKEWLRFVRKCRSNADRHKIRTVISPRASILGTQLIAQGIKESAVKDMLIFKGLNSTEKAKLVE